MDRPAEAVMFSNVRLERSTRTKLLLLTRIEERIDFLGYHFSPKELSVAEKGRERVLALVVRLYEQKRESQTIARGHQRETALCLNYKGFFEHRDVCVSISPSPTHSRLQLV